MSERGTHRFRIGLIALAWLLLLAVLWLLSESGVPALRGSGVARLAREGALLAALLGAAYGWGRLALMGWHTDRGERPEPVWAFALGFGVLQLATFAVSALHLLGPAWPWLLLAGGWAALLATLRPLPKLPKPDLARWGVGEWFLTLVMSCSLGYSLFGWALVPPLAWDEVSYHLPIPQLWIKAGGFVPIPTIVHSNWPAGMEMLNTLALLMGSEILPHLIVTSMVVLTAVGLARLARQHLDPTTAWLAAALYLSMPMVKFLAGVALIEGALGFFGFVALWAGYVWLKSQRGRDLIVAALLGGLAASVKLPGAAIPLTVGAVGLVGLLIHRRDGARPPLVQFAAYGLISLAVVAPWYVKSALFTGNPFWPFLYDLFGGSHWDAAGDRTHMLWLRTPNLAPTLRNYVGGLWILAVEYPRFGGMSMGAATVALAPLSALFLRRKGWLPGYLMAASALIYTLWFFTTHQTRFLMGMAPALVLLAAYAFRQLLQVWPGWLGALARVALALYFVVGLPFVDDLQWRRISSRWPYIAGHETRDAFLEKHVTGYEAFEWANAHLPPDAVVLLTLWETRGYYLERDAIWANPVSQRVIQWEQFDSPEEAMDHLTSLGITHLFHYQDLGFDFVANDTETRQLVDALLAEYGEVLYDRKGFAVYALSE